MCSRRRALPDATANIPPPSIALLLVKVDELTVREATEANIAPPFVDWFLLMFPVKEDPVISS